MFVHVVVLKNKICSIYVGIFIDLNENRFDEHCQSETMLKVVLSMHIPFAKYVIRTSIHTHWYGRRSLFGK